MITWAYVYISVRFGEFVPMILLIAGCIDAMIFVGIAEVIWGKS